MQSIGAISMPKHSPQPDQQPICDTRTDSKGLKYKTA